MTIELDSTLAQAEVLFLSFSQLVADIDRRRWEQEGSSTSSGTDLRNRHSSNSAKLANAQFSALQISDELRVLLL
jgi:hypothetical protein